MTYVYDSLSQQMPQQHVAFRGVLFHKKKAGGEPVKLAPRVGFVAVCLKLLGVAYSPCLTYHGNLDLTRIRHLGLDALC